MINLSEGKTERSESLSLLGGRGWGEGGSETAKSPLRAKRETKTTKVHFGDATVR